MATIMKRPVTIGLVICVVLALALVAYKTSIQTATTADSEQELSSEQLSVSIDSEYISVTRDEAIESADLIFAGKVTNISATQWNQDSGEYWRETTVEDAARGFETSHTAWPIHYVELSIIEPIIDEIRVDRTVTLTILGKSPVEQGHTTSRISVQIEGQPPHALTVDDEVIVFAAQTEIAWRDPARPIRLVEAPDGTTYFDIGTRSVISFLGNPRDSYLLKEDDGLYHSVEGATMRQEAIPLELLIQQIAQVRPISLQK